MILVIIGLLWVILLAPMALRRLRDRGAERSIESFHAEHEVLERQGYAVAPAHRLSEEPPAPAPRRPQLTVVHADDTYRTLESRSSWEEWDRAYDYDDGEGAHDWTTGVEYGAGESHDGHAARNRYAAAYSSVPRGQVEVEAPALRRRTARAQRRMVVTRLVLVVVALSALSFVVSSSILFDLAVLSWVAAAGYVALALFAMSQGYLEPRSLGLGRRADVADLDSHRDPYLRSAYEETPAEEEEWYDEDDSGWGRSSGRYALG